MTLHIHVLGSRPGAAARLACEAREQRFFGRPEFLLEPGAGECYPCGISLLPQRERALLQPGVALPYLEDDTSQSLTEIALELALQCGERCRAGEPNAVVVAHTCLSEDVSTCTSSRLIDALGLAAAHSFSVLGSVASAWTHAIECIHALHFGESPALATLLVAGEKWLAPFPRAYGNLFAMSDGVALAQLTAHAPRGQAHVVVRTCGIHAADAAPPWLTQAAAVDEVRWLRAVESGLAQLLPDGGVDEGESVLVLGPALGVTSAALRTHAPRLAALAARTSYAGHLPGHFGAADPFLRLQAALQNIQPGAAGRPVLLWSVGPEGDMGILTGSIGV